MGISSVENLYNRFDSSSLNLVTKSRASGITSLQITINVVFYDVTSLYFEIDQEDELLRTGFSKESKHQNPQIVLGLLVSKNEYPLVCDIFASNRF